MSSSTLLLSSPSTPFMIKMKRRPLLLVVLCLLLLPMIAVDAFQHVLVHPASPTRRISQSTSSSNNNDASADTDTDTSEHVTFRFLGRGQNAIIRPGCVLVAPSNEYHTFYRRAAIFIYGMGPDNTSNAPPTAASRGDGVEYIIRGLIIDFPTPFTLSEMMNHNPRIMENPLGSNFLFRGGDKGGDGVILLHNQKILLDNSNTGNEVGTSGVYQGGWDAALEACRLASSSSTTATMSSMVDNYKAFFNYCEFTEKELEDMLDSRGDDDKDDTWMSLEVDANFVLNQNWDRGDAWKRLRNAVRQQEETQQQRQQLQSNSGGSDGAAGTFTEGFS